MGWLTIPMPAQVLPPAELDELLAVAHGTFMKLAHMTKPGQ
jgi:hypothetical protein